MFIRNIDLHPGTGFMQCKTLMNLTTADKIITTMNQLVLKTGAIIFLWTLKMTTKIILYQRIVFKRGNIKITITNKINQKILTDLLPQKLIQMISSNMRITILSINTKGKQMNPLTILGGIGSQIRR